MNETVIVIGANSAIARALCHVLAARRCRLILAARNHADLTAFATDLRIRYAVEVDAEPFEAMDFDQYPEFFERCLAACRDTLTGVILCHGYLPEPDEAAIEADDIRRTIDVNFTSAALLLELFASHLVPLRRGFLASISSVAGDRGRQSNYLYGAAKSGLSAFLQGLRNRLYRSGVHVLTIKPGFVDTPMTQGRINPRSLLVASPERVARDIDRAIRQRKNVLYTPWFWRPIMTMISLIPESIFKRMRL